MDIKNIIRHICNAVYFIGILILICLIIIIILDIKIVPFPDSMLPSKLSELAFIWIAFGTIPIFLSSMAFYKISHLNSSTHKRRNIILVFIPSLICAIFAIFITFIILIAMIKFLFIK